MLIFLDGIDNRKGAPNENYAREVMELFTLGADRGAYTEHDIRQAAKALTGWRADYVDGVGFTNFRYDPIRHDTTNKTIFGKTGNYAWQDACDLCLQNPLHASFFVTKLWSYFVPVAIDEPTQATLQAAYVDNGYQITPVLELIFRHPVFLDGPAMVKPPVVAQRRAAARARPQHRHRRVGLAQRRDRPVPLLPAQRRGLGRHALDGHLDLARALACDRRRAAPTQDEDPAPTTHYDTEDGATARGRARWPRSATRRSRPRPRNVQGLRRRRPAEHDERHPEAHLPRDAPERAAPADPHLRRRPDLLRHHHGPPQLLQRLHPLALPAALGRQAGTGMPRSSPACRSPPAPA